MLITGTSQNANQTKIDPTKYMTTICPLTLNSSLLLRILHYPLRTDNLVSVQQKCQNEVTN